MQLTEPRGVGEDSSGDSVGHCGIASGVSSVPMFVVSRSHSRDTGTKWPSRLGACLLDIWTPSSGCQGHPLLRVALLSKCLLSTYYAYSKQLFPVQNID